MSEQDINNLLAGNAPKAEWRKRVKDDDAGCGWGVGVGVGIGVGVGVGVGVAVGCRSWCRGRGRSWVSIRLKSNGYPYFL